ncbi:MAG: phenylacetate--CoA ligase family protein, partial [Methylobacter sp.]
MNIYTQLTSNVIFPLHERLKKHDTVQIRKLMEQTQWLSPEELKGLQLQRLKAFLIDVEQHVPYYR